MKSIKLLIFFSYWCIIGFTNAQVKDSVYVQRLLDSGYVFERSAPDKAIKIYKKSLQISNEINYDKGAFRSLLYTGIVFSDNGKYDEAITAYKEALPFTKKIKYLKGEAATYVNIANTYQYKEDYFKAIQNYLNGISVYEKLRDSTNLAISYTNLAAIFDNVDNFKDEELYLKKALEFSKQNSVNYGITLCDLASNNLKKGVYNEAFNYLVEADSIKKFYNDNWLNFQVSRLYGEYYYFLKNYQKSVKYYETSLTDVEKLNNVFYKPEILGYLGNIYSKLGNKKIGLSYLKEAEKLNIQLKSRRNQKFIYQYLSEYYQKSDPKLALDYLSKSNKIKDSLNYFDNLKRVTYLENEFEITKKDNEIVQQQLEIAEQQNQLLESERKIFWGLSLFVLLGVVLVVLYFVSKQKQKLKDNEIIILKQKAKQTELEKLIEAEEKERTRIAQDLHDGVNGDLSAIKYHLSNINQDDLAKDLIKDLDKSIGMIDASCDQIRSISHNLSPYAIENYGLIDAVEQFCTKLNETNTTKIEFQNHGKVIHLPKFIETTLYRIIQELLSNTMKHSKAKEALVQINYQNDFMLITVEDDGVGFDVNKNKEGIGLKNIKSRVDLLEAKLSVDSNKTGSNFEIEIDLSNYI